MGTLPLPISIAESLPKPWEQRDSAFCNFTLVSIMSTACLAPPPPEARAGLSKQDWAMASVRGSPVRPHASHLTQETQFSNLSNRGTRNTAYLNGWFLAGRPRLARELRLSGRAPA